MEGFERDKDGGVELDALFFAVAVPATLFAGISKAIKFQLLDLLMLEVYLTQA